jgi:hypothetical protein
MSTATPVLTITELAAELHVEPAVVDAIVYTAPLQGELFAEAGPRHLGRYRDADGVLCGDAVLAPDAAAYVRTQLGQV